MTYIRHFSQNAAEYFQYRPDYPAALFRFLASLCEHHLAWDCATGNGQAALPLSDYFEQVIASDIYQQPLDVAPQKANIQYYCWPEDHTGLADSSVDLITVAQALHWFNVELFYQEVERVAKPKAIIAAWCYSLGSISPAIDILIKKLHEDILGDRYWPKERTYIDEGYQTLPFPFAKIATPVFQAEKVFRFSDLIGYFYTWSAVKEYQQQNSEDPILRIMNELETAWGDLNLSQTMTWPLHLLVGHVKSKI